MASSVVAVTAAAALIGFAINISVMAVILLRRSRSYHILFALLLLVAAFWDLGIFLAMIRNDFPDEILFYQTFISIPFNLFPALVYHFTTSFLNKPRRLSTIALYAYCIGGFILSLFGVFKTYNEIIEYDWGNIARLSPVYDPLLSTIAWSGLIVYFSWALVYFLSLFFSCWYLYQARKIEQSPVTRRHMEYILMSFIVFGVAYVKVLLTFGIDVPFLLPLGILLVDSFGAIIGLAIVKDRLFDITVYVRKGLFYSLFTAIIVFIFDFSQHLLATFLGGVVGEESVLAHYGSIAVIIIVFMPLKQRLEHVIEGVFAEKRIEV